MSTFNMTTEEFAESNGISKEAARARLSRMVKMGMATVKRNEVIGYTTNHSGNKVPRKGNIYTLRW